MTERTHAYSQRLDRLAIGVSTLCALHCLALPLMLPTLSTFFLGDAAFHRTLLLFVIPSSLLAVTLGCLRHKDARVWLLAAAGLSVMVLAAFWGHGLFGHWGERGVTLIGVSLLSLGHLRNYSLCRRDPYTHTCGDE